MRCVILLLFPFVGWAGGPSQISAKPAASAASEAPIKSLSEQINDAISDPNYPYRASAFQDGVQICQSVPCTPSPGSPCSPSTCRQTVCQNYFVKAPWHITSF